MIISQTIAGMLLYSLKNDSILFQHRDDVPHINEPNNWVLPGGNVDNKEDIKNGIKREFFEETGYKLFEPKLFYFFSIYEKNTFKEFYFFTEFYDDIQPIFCYEGQQMLFLNRDAMLYLNKPWYLDIILNFYTSNFNLFK